MAGKVCVARARDEKHLCVQEERQEIYLRQHDLDWLFRKGLRTFSFFFSFPYENYIFFTLKHERSCEESKIYFFIQVTSTNRIQLSLLSFFFFCFFVFFDFINMTHTYIWTLNPLILLGQFLYYYYFFCFFTNFLLLSGERRTRSLHKWIVLDTQD